MARSHAGSGRNGPALTEVALAAVEDFRLDDPRAPRVGRAEAEGEGRILADRYVGLEPKCLLAVIRDIEFLHEIGRDVVARHLIHLQPRTVRMADQQLHSYWFIRPRSVSQAQFHLAEAFEGKGLVLARGR